jgi:prolyl-tRNA editing enzyme YbaK/EbsC (Cys-tRNA(Pro) deacylase)
LWHRSGGPLVVLMHGDREVLTKALAWQAGRRSIQICRAAVTNRPLRLCSWRTSPFGTPKAMPVFIERSIVALPRVLVNGGSRGFLVGITPADLVRVLSPTLVDVAITP